MDTEPDFEDQSSTDEDYVPSGEESDDILSGDEFVSNKRGRSKTKKNQTKTRRKTAAKPKKRKRGIKLDDDDDDDDEEDEDFNKAEDNSDSVNESEDNTDDEEGFNSNESEKKLPEVDKKKSDSLWADFLKDVEPPAKSKCKTEQNLQTKSDSELKQQSNSEKAPTLNKKIITEVFDFAGESVSVSKEVDIDSEEAKKFENKTENDEQPESNKSAQIGMKRSSNIGNLLGKVMGKKPKMTTLLFGETSISSES